MSSASSLPTASLIALGAPSTRSLASFRPSEVISRTALMTWILLAPPSARMTSNSVFSSAASAGAAAAPPPPPTTTGAALTPHLVSSSLTSSAIWITGRFDRYSTTCSLLTSAIFLPFIHMFRVKTRNFHESLCVVGSGLLRRLWRQKSLVLVGSSSAAVLALLRVQQQNHLLTGRVEQPHEVLSRSEHRRQELGPSFVLVGQRRELRLDGFCVEHGPFEKTSFDLELLVL